MRNSEKVQTNRETCEEGAGGGGSGTDGLRCQGIPGPCGDVTLESVYVCLYASFAVRACVSVRASVPLKQSSAQLDPCLAASE